MCVCEPQAVFPTVYGGARTLGGPDLDVVAADAREHVRVDERRRPRFALGAQARDLGMDEHRRLRTAQAAPQKVP